VTNKLNVAVLMGGKSSEHEISLLSGREVARNLNPKKYNVYPINITRNGKKWILGERNILFSSPTLEWADKNLQKNKGKLMISKSSIIKDNNIGFVFIALHGSNGEDGTIQGFLELVGVPYSGSGVLASALSMHKEHSRQVLENNGFDVPKYILFNKNDDSKTIFKTFKLPLIVKPPNQGSSVGVSKVSRKNQLKTALSAAFEYSDTIMIEEFLDGTEITGSVLGNDNPKALPIVEIVPKNEFFDFESKYDETMCEEFCPARISKNLTAKSQKISLEVYKALGLTGFGRIDIIIKNNKFYILEANTVPGLTSLSLFPKAAKASGLSYAQLLDKIITYSLENTGKIKSMNSPQVYTQIDSWKKPIHFTKSRLAKIYLNLLPKTKVICITGSVGKTITQESIFQVLSQKYNVSVGSENLDPTFRIPQTILSTKPWHDFLILEYAVEHTGDMDFYINIAQPDIAVVTNINVSHTKYFKSANGVYQEKVKLIKKLPQDSLVILNSEDPYVSKMRRETHAQILWFGEKSKGVSISHFSQNLKGSSFTLHYNKESAKVSWTVWGKHQLQAAYASATLGISQGMNLKEIAAGLCNVKPPQHRLTLIKGKNSYILDDTYNSSPLATKAAIETLVDIEKSSPKIAVLGEMRDLGELSKSAHAKIGEQIAKTKISNLVTIGDKARIIAVEANKKQFSGKIINVRSTKEAVIYIRKLNLENALILAKGSRHEHLERVVFGLQNISTNITCYHCGKLK